MINISIDMLKITSNEDDSITIGSDRLTNWDKQLGHTKPVTIDGNFLLRLLMEKEIKCMKS